MNQEQVNELAMVIGRLVRRSRDANDTYGLSWTQRSVMGRLGKHGPATASYLARAESVKPQSMATIIAELEGRHIVERRSHPTDRRQMLVALTEFGMALREEIRAAKLSWFTERIEKLTPQEQEILVKAGEILKRVVDE